MLASDNISDKVVSCWATYAFNAFVYKRGFSPFQLVYRVNNHFPRILEASPIEL